MAKNDASRKHKRSNDPRVEERKKHPIPSDQNPKDRPGKERPIGDPPEEKSGEPSKHIKNPIKKHREEEDQEEPEAPRKM